MKNVTIRNISKEDLRRVKNLADEQFDALGQGKDTGNEVGIEFEGMWIIDPWMDDSARFRLTDEQAIELYGIRRVNKFIRLALDRLNETA